MESTHEALLQGKKKKKRIKNQCVPFLVILSAVVDLTLLTVIYCT